MNVGKLNVRVPKARNFVTGPHVVITSSTTISELHCDVNFVPIISGYRMMSKGSRGFDVTGGKLILLDWNSIQNYATTNRNLWLYGLSPRIFNSINDTLVDVLDKIVLLNGGTWTGVRSMTIHMLELACLYTSFYDGMKNHWSVPDRRMGGETAGYQALINNLAMALLNRPFVEIHYDYKETATETSYYPFVMRGASETLMSGADESYSYSWRMDVVNNEADPSQPLILAGTMCTVSRARVRGFEYFDDDDVIISMTPVWVDDMTWEYSLLKINLRVNPQSGWTSIAELHAANVFFHIGQKINNHCETAYSNDNVITEDINIELFLGQGTRSRSSNTRSYSDRSFGTLWDSIIIKSINNRVPLSCLFRVKERSFLAWAKQGWIVYDPLQPEDTGCHLGRYIEGLARGNVISRINQLSGFESQFGFVDE